MKYLETIGLEITVPLQGNQDGGWIKIKATTVEIIRPWKNCNYAFKMCYP